MAIYFSGDNGSINVNTGNLGANPKQVMRLSNSLQKCRSFGKAWEVGDQGTVFYPFKWWPDESMPSGGSFEFHMAAYYGHVVSDYKVLGTGFLRSLARVDENGQLIGDGDLAYQFSKIAGLLVTAQKEKELAELNEQDWSILGNSAYQTARAKIEANYNTKENMDAKKPLLGPLTITKLTEVVYVAMDPNTGTPIFDNQRKQKTGTYIQTLSDGRLNKLRALANDINCGILAQNPGLEPNENDIYFLEVLYNFTSAKNSKAEAGRVDPQGVAQSVTILARNPQLESKLKELQVRIPKDCEGIAAHAYGLSPIPEEVLKGKLQQILFERGKDLTYLSPVDKDRLVKNAKLLDYLRIAPKNDPELCARLEETLGHPVGAAVTTAPTLESIMVGDTPDFSQQKTDISSVDEEMFAGDIDLGGEEG